MIHRVTFILAIALWFFTYANALVAASADSTKTKHSRVDDITVLAERFHEQASESSFAANDMILLPHSSAQDVLRLVPGLILAQHAGGGKAEQIFLRGFDCDHGTDVAIDVDGLAVNMVSHGHGQGYADMHFIIPECISEVTVQKGPYNAAYGDLATAGAVHISTIDSVEHSKLQAEVGSFSTYRALALSSTRLAQTSILGAVEYAFADGFFTLPQRLQRFNTMLKSSSQLSSTVVWDNTLFGFHSSWNASGQIPLREVQAGRLGTFGSLDSNEGGSTTRLSYIGRLSIRGDSPTLLQASCTYYAFDLFSNFTSFLHDTQHGDMIEQGDHRIVISTRSEKEWTPQVLGAPGRLRVGFDTRSDFITVGLFHSPNRERSDTSSLCSISQHNESLWLQHTSFYGRISLIVAGRIDAFQLDVQDDHSHTRQNDNTLLFSPKLSIVYELNDGVTIFVNSGYGFHSNDARSILRSNQTFRCARALGSELGIRASTSSIQWNIVAWMLDMDAELVWSGDEGTTESSGRTRRVGVDLNVRARVSDMLSAGLDASMCRGRFRDLPDGSNYIPLAPPLSISAYLSARTAFVEASLRLRHIADRPANEDNSLRAQGYTVVDLSLESDLTRHVTLRAELLNLANASWREAQFATTSRLSHEPHPVDDINFTAGCPRMFKTTLAYAF